MTNKLILPIVFAVINLPFLFSQEVDLKQPDPDLLKQFMELSSFKLSENGEYNNFMSDAVISPGYLQYRQFTVRDEKGHLSLLVLDGKDLTPFLIVANGDAISYDVVSKEIFLIRDVSIASIFEVNEEKRKAEWEMGVKLGKENDININIESVFLADNFIENKVEYLGEETKKIKFTATTVNKKLVTAIANPKSVIPIESIELKDENGVNPILTLSITGEFSLKNVFLIHR